MGFVRNAGDAISDIKEDYRWITILPALEEFKLPEVKFKVKHVNDQVLARLAKPFAPDAKRKEKEVDLGREMQFRRKLLVTTVDDWQGVCNGNVRRMSDFFLKHPELMDDSKTDAWDFSVDDLGVIGEHITTELFSEILAEVTDLNAFVQARLEQEKNV